MMHVPSKNYPNRIDRYMYVVTAKHVIDRASKSEGKYYLRVNDINRNYILVPIEKDYRWYNHPKHNDVNNPIDVAITRFDFEIESNVTLIPIEMCLKLEEVEEKIKIGNEIFIVGLFNYHSGMSGNEPIVRTGSMAMFPKEKIRVDWPKKNGSGMEAYLIETRSISGLSGSPVFFERPARITKNGGDLHIEKSSPSLVGLIHGHYDESENKINNVNTGIAIVVPAVKIYETLMQEKLQEMRRRWDSEYEV